MKKILLFFFCVNVAFAQTFTLPYSGGSGGASNWGAITGKPTTLSGYGITDAYPLSGNPSGYLSSVSFAQVASKPTTLSGYGITDAYPLNSNPSGYLSSVSFAQLTGKPTTLAGYGITDGLSNIGGTTGFVGFQSQTTNPATPSNGFRLYANSANALSWIGNNGYIRTFDGTSNTGDRTYILPNASGTIALTSDITTGATWGNITGTISNQTDLNTSFNLRASLSANNVFTGATNSFNVINSTGDSKFIPSNYLEIAGNPTLRFNRSGSYLWQIGTGFSGLLSNFIIRDESSSAHRLMITHSNGNILINSTTDSGERFQVTGTAKFTGNITNTTGDIELLDNTKGLILKSADGTRYRIRVATGGTLTATAL